MNNYVSTLKHIDQRTIVKSVLLPGIMPRIKELFASPLSFLALVYAHLFYVVKLLPANHPYLLKKNFGKYGLIDVLGAANENIEFSFNHIDRVIAYFCLIASIVMVILLALTALVYLVISNAWSQHTFLTPNPTTDIALNMLEATLGIPNVYCTNGICPIMMQPAPSGFHSAMQEHLFGTYNRMFLIIGTLIVAVHVLHAVFDTTQSGTLFGQRFNSFWGPFRLLMGIGLLMPVAYHMNAGQYIILYAAKYGSGMATNGWVKLTNEANIPIGGVDVNAANGMRDLITTPSPPDYNGFIGFMHIVKTCEYWYRDVLGRSNMGAYQIYGTNSVLVSNGTGGGAAIDYNTAVTNSQNGPINIVFGHKPTGAANEKDEFLGSVEPYCGEISIDVTNAGVAGVNQAFAEHYNVFMQLYNDEPIRAFARHIAYATTQDGTLDPCDAGPSLGGASAIPCAEGLPANYPEFYYGPAAGIKTSINLVVSSAVTGLQFAPDLAYETNLLNLGWAGAGMWYGKVAEMNGTLQEAVMSTPSARKKPAVLDKLIEYKRRNVNNEASSNQFDTSVVDEKGGIKYIVADREEDLMKILAAVYKLMLSPGSAINQNTITDSQTGSAVLSLLNMVFGTSGIFDAANSTTTHAMFQLTAIGKSLIESSIRNLLTSTMASVAGGMLSQFDDPMAQAIAGTSNGLATLTLTIGQLTITAGIILYYIIPLMPFMYFFFACGRWVKSVFEALVGAPLWALAHLKYDGEGVGDMAISGYYLTFEIFIRPILIVFGLIAALSIFGAMVTVMNDIWSLVYGNLSGYDYVNSPDDDGVMRGRIDQVFFTILYIIVIYMMAQSSFKLIDLIPNGILRWFGSSTSSFGDMAQDPMDKLTQTAAISGAQMIPKITGAANAMAAGGGRMAGGIGKNMMNKP